MKKTETVIRHSAPNLSMLRRAVVLMILLGGTVFVLLIARLAKLQLADHGQYEELALSQQLRQVETTPQRGTIYDRNGKPLAVSATAENIYLSPAEIAMYGEDRELIARKLAEILDQDYTDLYEKTGNTASWYVTVAKKVDKETADKVRDFKTENGLRGVRLETDSKRYYPNSSLACHIIGFVGTDNYGLEGIEAQYNTQLTGTSGKTVRATNAYGTDMLLTRFEQYTSGESGCDIVTTVDSTIQYYIEKQLKQAVEDYDILNGAGAIAMDVNTGAILAMASVNGYDLNDFLAISKDDQIMVDSAATEEEANRLLRYYQTKQWRNKALSDTYEPGSTFKIITLSMALEEGVINENDSFYCGGNVNVVGRTSPIRCWKDGGHGSQTLTQAVQHSCNVAFVNIGQRVGAENFYKYCEAFGLLNLTGDPDENLTASTGIDLSGESGSIWWSENVFYSEKNKSQLAAASFGQTFTVTPLQLITAVSACVNGGYLMKPYVVDSMLAPDGTVRYKYEPECVRQVISEQTSQKVRTILEQVVGDEADGTGRNASVAGYRIGGKTGTSEKVSLEAATGEKEYIVSFIGFAPADNPKIAILIFLDTPSDKTGIYISGGQMAAPVVGRIFADVLPYMGVEAKYTEEELNRMDVTVPAFEGMSLEQARICVENAGLKCRTVGAGNTVTAQLPYSGSKIAAGTEIILYLDAEISAETEVMPEILGMTYSHARDILSYYAIYISTPGNVYSDTTQVISSQTVPAGTELSHGSIVEVTLIDSDQSIIGRY